MQMQQMHLLLNKKQIISFCVNHRLNRLKYVELYFPHKLQNHYVNNNYRPDADRQSVVNSAYIRHANAGDYFPGGMDSSNTEATLLSRNTSRSISQPGGMFCNTEIPFLLKCIEHFERIN